MSYQVLARKWRPRFFDEMVGQEHVLRALINALNEQRLHHAYLFTGTRGVGKTTIARILAKCLNCEEGISARPCGTCSACREIADGRFVDLIEVDAASRTKVEDTRELLDNVQYAPTRGRFKVYLIDEVHMLSTHSFNALLKTLEEPPEHVKFLLATTDPQKLPITVLSRCLQFSLKNMTPESIVDYLESVLKSERVDYELPALWQLGRAAQGSMRDALSLTDQAIAFGEGQIGESQVTRMLGTMDRGRLFRLAEVMARGNAAEVMEEASEMAGHGPDFDEVVQGLMNIWHRAAIAQVLPEAIENSQGDREAILLLARAMNGEDLQLYYQMALSGRKDLALAPDVRQGFEMLLLRMLAFRPAPEAAPPLNLTTALQQSISAESEKKKHLIEDGVTEPDITSDLADPDLAHRADGVDPASGSDVPVLVSKEHHDVPSIHDVETSPVSDAVAEQNDERASGMLAIEGNDSMVVPSPQRSDSLKSPELTESSTEQVARYLSLKPGLVASMLDDDSFAGQHLDAAHLVEADSHEAIKTLPDASAGVPVSEEAKSISDLPPLAPHTWWQWLEFLPLAGLPLSIARNSALVSIDQSVCHFEVDAQQGALFNDGQRQKIEQALRKHIPDCRITMALGVPTGETPEQRRQRLEAEANYMAQQAIESDLAVRTLISQFNAVVLPDSIRPINQQEK